MVVPVSSHVYANFLKGAAVIVTRHCWQRHYVFRLSHCPIHPVIHDILWMTWTISIKLTGNIH